MSLEQLQTTVDDLVRDRDGVVSDTQRNDAIDAAVRAYSIDRPRNVVVDITASGGQRIDLPAGFTDASRLRGIEYPVGDVPPSEVPLSEISIYDAPSVRQIALPMWVAAGDTLRVSYTAAHLVDDADDTLPDGDRFAVACKAASILCGQLAAYYAGESEPTLAADTVNRQTKSQAWRQRARDLAADYATRVGPAPNERRKAASATTSLERNDALGGRRLFHPTRVWPDR